MSARFNILSLSGGGFMGLYSAKVHEQTDTTDPKDQELADLQRSAQAPGRAGHPVRPRGDPGHRAWRRAWPTALPR